MSANADLEERALPVGGARRISARSPQRVRFVLFGRSVTDPAGAAAGLLALIVAHGTT